VLCFKLFFFFLTYCLFPGRAEHKASEDDEDLLGSSAGAEGYFFGPSTSTKVGRLLRLPFPSDLGIKRDENDKSNKVKASLVRGATAEVIDELIKREASGFAGSGNY
jgi:hypothetical protein